MLFARCALRHVDKKKIYFKRELKFFVQKILIPESHRSSRDTKVSLSVENLI